MSSGCSAGCRNSARRACSWSATSCSTATSTARSSAWRPRRRSRCWRSSARSRCPAAPATWCATSPRSAPRSAFVAVVGDDPAGSDLTGLHRRRSRASSPGCWCRAAAPPRPRPASSRPASSCCAPTSESEGAPIHAAAGRPLLRIAGDAVAADGGAGAVRLRQGRAGRRRRAAELIAARARRRTPVGGRSEGRRLRALSRRRPADAEPRGAGRGDAACRSDTDERDRRRGARAASARTASSAVLVTRGAGRHDPGRARGAIHHLAGRGARGVRRVGRRRHGGRDASPPALAAGLPRWRRRGSANAAAGIVVGKLGTATCVRADELARRAAPRADARRRAARSPRPRRGRRRGWRRWRAAG